MAVIAQQQVVLIWSNDAADRTALYRVSNVNGGDTADLAGQFQRVVRAVFLATTSGQAAPAPPAGTVVTLPAALNGDAGYLLAWGPTG